MKCKSCIHNEVCKNKEAFEAKFKELNNNDMFEVELKCKNFKDIYNPIIYNDLVYRPFMIYDKCEFPLKVTCGGV